MLDTVLEVKNSAVLKLKEPEITASSTGVVANAINDHYDRCRKIVLAKHKWNFAIKRVELTTAGSAVFGYTNRMPTPTTMLRLLTIFPQYQDPKPQFEGTFILTNESKLQIKYIDDIEDVQIMPDQFVEAFAFYLAKEVAPLIEGGRVSEETLEVKYNIAISDAMQQNLIESPFADLEDAYIGWESAGRSNNDTFG